jgi:hypothetical protein
MGMRTVVRDHEGRVVAALCASIPYTLEPTTAEALATWKVAEYSTTLGFRKLILEGDLLEVVHALCKDSWCWGLYRHLADDAKSLLNMSI